MSAALQLPLAWEASNSQRLGEESLGRRRPSPTARQEAEPPANAPSAGPVVSLSVCFHAGRAGAFHPGRSHRAGMGIEPPGAHV